jgi:putative transposase
MNSGQWGRRSCRLPFRHRKMSYSERRLPHWIPDQTSIFVTWRLAGTLPRAARVSSGSGAGNPVACQSASTPESSWMEMDAALDQTSLGPRWLIQPMLADVVAKALCHGEKVQKYRLHAWVVMPNHVHAVITPDSAFSGIMRWLKWTTARRSNQLLGRCGTAFWQDESFDHWVRNGREFDRIVSYVEWNPVAAGLVERADQWRWSSASWQATRSPAPPE